MTFSTQSAEYTLVFSYDASGRPVSVTMNGDVFYYVTNLQGDVMALLDADGRKVGSYSYTAYGEVSISMGHTVTLLNPLLYRGYVHDLETTSTISSPVTTIPRSADSSMPIPSFPPARAFWATICLPIVGITQYGMLTRQVEVMKKQW